MRSVWQRIFSLSARVFAVWPLPPCGVCAAADDFDGSSSLSHVLLSNFNGVRRAICVLLAFFFVVVVGMCKNIIAIQSNCWGIKRRVIKY